MQLVIDTNESLLVSPLYCVSVITERNIRTTSLQILGRELSVRRGNGGTAPLKISPFSAAPVQMHEGTKDKHDLGSYIFPFSHDAYDE